MLRALTVALVAAGCSSPPHWSLPLGALDRVALSTARAGNLTWVVGGALGSGGDALALAYDGKAWSRVAANTDATLWWVAAVGSEVWAVGERGTVLRGGAQGLAPVSVPTTTTLYGVWGSPQGNVWLVGGEPDLSGVVLRGTADGGWVDLTPPASSSALFKVWGAADDDVWICGQTGALWHWNGTALAAVDAHVGRATLFTVAGRSANDVYAVGGQGIAVALHWDGAAWSPLGDAVFADAPGLNGVSVDGDGTVIIVGSGGTKLRGRPGAFVDETAQATREDLHAALIAGGEVFTVGGNYLAQPPTPRHGVVAHYGGDVASTIK